ncbi:MAG: universal stress protein [Ignavibacteriaceae bacterium]|nr:universal stress protein [Ignavibacteriaceae bacterium]
MIEFKKILVPVDFSNYSRNAIKFSVEFAIKNNAHILMLYVIEPIIYPADLSIGQIALPSVNLDLDQTAKSELEKLAQSEIGDAVQTTCIIKYGKPFLEIIETARDEDADLIIISSHGRSGVEHILFGSTADKVVRKSPCPVLTIREPLKGFNYKDVYHG